MSRIYSAKFINKKTGKPAKGKIRKFENYHIGIIDGKDQVRRIYKTVRTNNKNLSLLADAIERYKFLKYIDDVFRIVKRPTLKQRYFLEPLNSKTGRPYVTYPKRGTLIQYAIIDSSNKSFSVLNTSHLEKKERVEYYQEFDLKKLNSINKALIKVQGDSFVLFEDKEAQIVGPVKTKPLKPQLFNTKGTFLSDILPFHVYLKEHEIVKYKNYVRPNIKYKEWYPVNFSGYDSLDSALRNFEIVRPKNLSKKARIGISFKGRLVWDGETYDFANSFIPENLFHATGMCAKMVVSELARFGQRFTNMKTLERFQEETPEVNYFGTRYMIPPPHEKPLKQIAGRKTAGVISVSRQKLREVNRTNFELYIRLTISK